MRLSSVAKPILFSSLLLLIAAPAVAQTKEEKAAARATAEAGGDAFDAGKFAEAADLYERAERLMHAPTHLLYAARAHQKAGHLVEAREQYLALTREQLSNSSPRAFRDAQQMGERELEELEPRLPYISVVVQGGGGDGSVRVTRNGQAVPGELLGVPTPINPGKYTYQAFAEGMESSANNVSLSEGVRETVVLTLRDAPGQAGQKAMAASATPGSSLSEPMATDTGPSSRGRPLLIGGIAGLGLAAVGAGVGTIFVLKSGSTHDTGTAKFDECDPGCSDKEVASIDAIDDDSQLQLGIGIGSYVVGGLGLAAGITLLVLDANRSTVASSSIMPVIGLNHVGVAGRF